MAQNEWSFAPTTTTPTASSEPSVSGSDWSFASPKAAIESITTRPAIPTPLPTPEAKPEGFFSSIADKVKGFFNAPDFNKPVADKTFKEKTDLFGQIKESAKSSFKQAEEGIDTIREPNPKENAAVQGVEGALKTGAGVAGVIFSPLAPLTNLIGKAINFAGGKLSDSSFGKMIGVGEGSALADDPTTLRVLDDINNLGGLAMGLLGAKAGEKISSAQIEELSKHPEVIKAAEDIKNKAQETPEQTAESIKQKVESNNIETPEELASQRVARSVTPNEDLKPTSENIETTPRLRTADFGKLEGELQTPESNKYVHDQMRKLNAPMGRGGETFNNLASRVIDYVKEIISKGEDHVGMTTHNSVYGLIKLWDEQGRSDWDSMSIEDKHKFVEDYIKQDNTNPPGDSYTIKTPAGDIELMRHGKTDQNGTRFRTPEAKLVTEGQQQAVKLGDAMKEKGLTKIYSSDLPRAVETSNIVMDRVNGKEVSVPEAKEVRSSTVQLNAGIDPGINEFIKQDITPRAKGVFAGVAKTWDFIKKQFNPTARGPEAVKTASIMREALAKMVRRKESTYHVLEKSRKIFDKYSEQESLDFIDKLETGEPIKGAEEFTKAMREALDSRYKRIQEIKGSDAYIENYFPHIWEDPAKAGEALKQFMAKRPLEGSKSFLKERTIPTVKEGIELGLKPASFNPVDLIMSKVSDMDKFLMANDVWTQFKTDGLRKFVATGDRAPEGWKLVDDKISHSFQFSQTEKALISRGKWYMPEAAATVVNNYLSPGLSNNPIYQAFRMLGNTLNQAQLSLSGFHLMFTSIDAVNSKMAIELQKTFAESGTGAERTKALGTALASPVTSPYILYQNLIRGNKLLTDYFSKNPEVPELVNALERAGGRAKMDSFYKNNAVENFFKAVRSGNYLGALARFPGFSFEGLNKFISEDIVPRQKLGVFSDMATHILDQASKGNWSEYQTTLRLQEAWDSVDNRLGQLTYDNLFWNKTLKDMGMVATRSLGWNLGSIREIPGGLLDLAKTPYKAFKGTARMTPKMGYVLSLPYVVGIMGAITYYMYHGKAPQKLEDYYAIPTNKTKTDGTPEKVLLPSYMKDVIAYSQQPIRKTVGNKLAPEFATISQMLDNRDFFGSEIRNPNDPLVTQAEDLAKYQASQFVPFSITNLIQREKTKGGNMTWIDYLQSFGGITPAPAYMTRTSLQNKIYDLADKRLGGGTTTKEATDIANKKRDVRTLYLTGKTEEANTALEALVKSGAVKNTKLFIEEADIPNDVKLFKRFAAEDQKALLKTMSLVDLNRYAWYSDKAAKSSFSSLSENTKNWLELGKEGKIKAPQWKQGQLIDDNNK